MLAQLNTIRDVSRALPALTSGADFEAIPVSTALVDSVATGLRKQHASLRPVLNRAGEVLAEAMKEHPSEETIDPEGDGAVALEQAEAYFKGRREELQRLRESCIGLGTSSSHRVFNALQQLDDLYASIIDIMQDVRWSVLISDGVRDRADSPAPRTFATSSDWLASLNNRMNMQTETGRPPGKCCGTLWLRPTAVAIEDLKADVDRTLGVYERLIAGAAARTRPMIEQYGHVEALRRLVEQGELQSGFKALRDNGLLQGSFEQLVVKHGSTLFQERTVQAAQWRLDHPHD